MKKICFVVLLFFATLGFCEPMIEIDVEIMEINENRTKELGIQLPISIDVKEMNIPTIIESGSWERLTAFAATLKTLESKGAAKVLSKPKLVTKSGTSAKFMVGGEFPVIASGVGSSSVDWKEWGIIMKITPTILKNSKIDISIDTELSRIDYNVSIGSYPAISKRQASSHLQMQNGETMALAGLIETTKNKVKTGIPFLSDVPIIGLLFSTVRDYDTKTNVVIFVTPKFIEE
ncbi:MAG: type II and III secretion system protein [Elusimicrobiota bacterium]|jgi:pilus assembly protein CpaC|nr:type II and III secretion system protein [Elusimicrobiota bacterium]